MCVGIAFVVLAASPAASAEPRETAPNAFTIGRLLALEGDYRQALEHLRLAARLAPQDPFAHLELASLAYRLGRGDEAVEHARKAVALAPDDPDVLQGVADLFLGLADDGEELLADARAALERLLVLRPDDPGTLHALGRLHHSEGDLEKAEELFRRLVAAAPESRTASTQLLHLLLQAGKKREAAELLREQLAASPDALELRLTLADLLGDTGDHTAAAEVLRAAPGDHAAHPDLQRRLAFALYRAGEVAEASAFLDQLLAANPRDLRLRLFRALLLEEQGRAREALAELEMLHRELPADPEVTLSLARLLAGGERREEARHLLRDLLGALARRGESDLGVSDRVRLELAQLAAEDGAWDEVLAALAELSPRSEAPLRGASLLLRSDALVALERGDEALALLQPDSGLGAEPLHGKRAEVLLALGRDDEAAAELARLGEGPASMLRAADVYQRADRHAEALPLLEQLTAAEPESIGLQFRLGAAYERVGRRPEAVATFRALIAREPDFHMALNYLGYMWAEKGENLDEALELVQRALTFEPDNAAYLDSLGWVYYQMGDHRRALEQLQRAARLLPGDATVQEHLGDVQRALGNIGEARAAYERALTAGDDNAPQVRRKLEEVGQEQPRR